MSDSERGRLQAHALLSVQILGAVNKPGLSVGRLSAHAFGVKAFIPFLLVLHLCAFSQILAQTVPPPKGFVEGSTLSEELKTIATGRLPPSAKVLGWYFPPDALAEILRTGSTSESPSCKATRRKEHATSDDAKAAVRRSADAIRKEVGKPFDAADPELRKKMKPVEDFAGKVRSPIRFKINGFTPLGITSESDTSFSCVFLLTYKWSKGDVSVDMPIVGAAAYVALGKSEVELSVSYPFDGEKSITAANDTLAKWLKSVEDANRGK